MKENYFLFYVCIITFLLVQCKSSELTQITKLVKNTTSINFLNPEEFESGRRLMFEKLTDDIVNSDTIIILEFFSDGEGGSYYAMVYESNGKTVKSYDAIRNLNKFTIDSLVYSPNYDNNLAIVKMVRDGLYDEVKLEGDNTTLTPQTRLIINILTRKNKNKISRETIVTCKFIAAKFDVKSK